MHMQLGRIRLLGILLLFASPIVGQALEPKHPNIVFIMADDLGINDLGCYGRKDHATPNLDRLAAGGIRFTNAYSAQSVCSPNRAALITGLSPARLHLTTFLPGRGDAVSQLLLHPKIELQLREGVETIADKLKKLGYRSACIGKWHLGGKGCLPTDRGFDVYHPGVATTKPSPTEAGKGEYDLTEQVEKFIEANQKQPFFVYLNHNNPHIPLSVRPELVEKYPNAFNPTYAAMMETLDDSVGRVVKKLDDLGLRKDTLIVFTSDNGGLHTFEGGQTPTHNTPFRAGKGFLYEGGIRVPLIMNWLGKLTPNKVDATPVIATDWTPTLASVAGGKESGVMDGVDLWSHILNQTPLPQRALYWHQPHYMNQGSRPVGAMRDGPWKLIENYENGQCELYHLEKDIGETTDIAASDPNRVAEMRGRLEKWRRDAKAQSNRANPNFQPNAWKALYADVNVSQIRNAERSSVIDMQLKSWRQLMNNVINAKKNEPGAGAVFVYPADAMIHGEKLRYEPEPHKDTLGYWVNPADWVEWKVTVPHTGSFDVELLQAAGKGSGGAEVQVTIGDQPLKMIVEETGHFQRFVPRTIGQVLLKEGETQLTIRAKTKPGVAVMDLRRIVLRAAPNKE